MGQPRSLRDGLYVVGILVSTIHSSDRFNTQAPKGIYFI